jgi:hypothetical protein
MDNLDDFDIFREEPPIEVEVLPTVKSSWGPTAVETDREEAKQAAKEIDELLDEIKSGELCLATNYAKLGNQLLKIRSKKHWIALGFRSFGSYIESIKERIDKGRTQLYMFISVAEKLLPSIAEEDLNRMGISKALELQRIVAQTGMKPPQDLIERALNPVTTREQLRGEVFKHLHCPEDEQGTYWDLGGFYVTPEERKEINRGFDIAARVDPVVPLDWPEHARKKEIMQRLIREFLSTYEQLVERGEG